MWRERCTQITSCKQTIRCLVIGDGKSGKKNFLRDTDGTRAKGRRTKCSREIALILEGTLPLSTRKEGLSKLRKAPPGSIT